MRPAEQILEMSIFLTSQQSASFSKRTLIHWLYWKDTSLKSALLHCSLYCWQ